MVRLNELLLHSAPEENRRVHYNLAEENSSWTPTGPSHENQLQLKKHWLDIQNKLNLSSVEPREAHRLLNWRLSSIEENLKVSRFKILGTSTFSMSALNLL